MMCFNFKAVKRVMERDNASEERARNRLSNQVSNEDCVHHAHVIFSTQWDYEYTQSQVRYIIRFDSF